MGRAPCCDKANVKRGPWSPDEDDTLRSYIQTHGTGGNWIALPRKIGLKRCGKSCRLRWLNYLRPNIKHGGFTEDEDNLICSLFLSIGSRWSIIAAQLPGRTDNDIKNYWNTRLRKKLILGRRQNRTIINNFFTSPSPCPRAFDSPLVVDEPITFPCYDHQNLINYCYATTNNCDHQMLHQFSDYVPAFDHHHLAMPQLINQWAPDAPEM